MVEGNGFYLGLKDDSCPMIYVVPKELEHHGWYIDIVYYLKKLTSPRHLLDYKKLYLRLNASKYCFINQILGWRNPNELILICVNPKEENDLMDEFHKVLCGGHHVENITTHVTTLIGYMLKD